MKSDATTVEEYLASLPEDRRQAISRVRELILSNLPNGYEEVMNWGMITYQVPLDIEPDTYNGKPLLYAALASQKHHMALYLTAVYADPAKAAAFRHAYAETGKRMDIGRSCVRFRTLDELPLELLGETIRATPVGEFLEMVARSSESTG